MQRQRWRKTGENGENTGMAADESQKQKEVIDEARNKGRKVHFASLMGLCPSQEFGAGASISRVQRKSRTPKWHCERWFRIIRSIYWTKIISITNDGRNSHGYHLQIARLRWTSSGRSICLYPGKNGRCFKITEKFPNLNVQTFGFVYHDTNGQNQGPVLKTQSFLLSEICMVILQQDSYGNGNSRKFHWNTVGKKFHISIAYSMQENAWMGFPFSIFVI